MFPKKHYTACSLTLKCSSMSASTAPPSSGAQVGTKERITASSSQAPGSTTRNRNPTPKWVDTLLFWLDWAIKVLSVAAAVVFGIWAPLSFQAANDASASGDATQSSVMSAVNSVNGQASSALRIQSSAAAEQSVALDAMNSRIGAIGQLSLLDFCLRNIVRKSCIQHGSESGLPYNSRSWQLVNRSQVWCPLPAL